MLSNNHNKLEERKGLSLRCLCAVVGHYLASRRRRANFFSLTNVSVLFSLSVSNRVNIESTEEFFPRKK